MSGALSDDVRAVSDRAAASIEGVRQELAAVVANKADRVGEGELGVLSTCHCVS